MFDLFEHLGPKRHKLLDDSWAGIFRLNMRQVPAVELLARYFCAINGRPTNELVAMMGAMILQHMHDLTDQETVEQFAFNNQWHYAVNNTNNEDTEAYVCQKSIWSMRAIMTGHGLYDPVFQAVGDGELSQETRDRYLHKEETSAFAMIKPFESAKTLEIVGNDLFFLVEHFRSHGTILAGSSYQFMVYVLKEQYMVEEDAVTGGKRIIIKANKEIASDSLQNPSDPDAGYDRHKGKGYQTQIGETCNTSEDEKTPQLSLITYVDIEPAHASNANALVPYIEATQERDIAPEEILADSLYGSDSNYEQAGEEGIELVASIMGKPRDATCCLSDCEFSDDGVITVCPQGHTPVKVKQNKGGFSAAFPLSICFSCPLFAHCPAKGGKNDRCYIRYGQKAVRLAHKRMYERTDAFKQRYRLRAGVEATMSQLDRWKGLKHLQVRGLKAVRFAATLKTTAINILLVAACRKWRKMAKDPGSAPFAGIFDLFRAVKDRYLARFGNSISGKVRFLDCFAYSVSILGGTFLRDHQTWLGLNSG